MKKTFTHSFRALAAVCLMMLAQAGYAQTFTTCTGQNILSITGATTSTITNDVGMSVNIQITARGGDGGNETDCCALAGGSGATMIGEFVLANGATLRAISGGVGGTAGSGGGGGGAGAVNCGNPSDCANGTILIIAAAGGGADGGGLSGIGGSAGTGGSGNGGANNGFAGGGGGVNSNGAPFPSGQYGGIVNKTGLSTGVGNGDEGMGGGGGFTGGGGSGGGGGHTGGGAGAGSAASSLNSGTSQMNTSGGDGAGTQTVGSVSIVCLSVLPVELVDFKAAVAQGKVALQWQTASELNNLGYQVQRSPDARHWKDLGFVAGAGTTTNTERYEYTDANPLPGMNYYRLRQTDFDGGFEHSPIVIVNVGFASKALTFFPNPAPEGITSLYFPEAPEGECLLEVFDWLGNKVHRQAVLLEGGSEVLVPVDLHSFPAGMYVAMLEMGGKVFSEKLMLKR
ncbi:MAG: T9SS type A sorting domain-containing protein [Bacteroidetes bacterium]|nr:T9SS type A sorting domain-containing protein [Bacteroidota bacterium]